MAGSAPDRPSAELYATPRRVERPEDCWFYHTIDLPGVGTVPGQWDLRGGVDDYLGRVPLAGKRVLELGTASGFLCFEMERRGAEVVAFDLAPGLQPDILPLASHPHMDRLRGEQVGFMERLRNSYWFSHGRLGSAARVVYGNLYDLPAGIGPVDVSTFGSILLHLRDPFLAVANAARLTRETVIVTDAFHGTEWEGRVLGAEFLPPPPSPLPPGPRRPLLRRAGGRLRRAARVLIGRPDPPRVVAATPPATVPAMVFLPDASDSTLLARMNSWWQFTPALIQRFLGVLGFGDTTVTTHVQKYQGQHPVRHYTVVGRRTVPFAPAR